MSEVKANKRWTNFWNSNMPLASPRGRYLLSKYPKDLGHAVRDAVKGIPSSFSAPGLKEFELGYELVGLDKRHLNLESVYSIKGIDYVNGVISRFKDERRIGVSKKIYCEALRFRDNYNSNK